MEIKQHLLFKQCIKKKSQGNHKILRDKWNWKYNIPKLREYTKSSTWKFKAVNAYIIIESSQKKISNQ